MALKHSFIWASRHTLFSSCLLLLYLVTISLAEPVQYCMFGVNSAEPASNSEVDFCIGAHMWHNATAQDHDLYITLTVRRPQGSALGWTAVGAGDSMDGSLMFIVYGDPASAQQPIVSIRTTTSHHQPKLLQRSDMPFGMDLRVVSAMWFRDETDPGSHFARVHIVCYACRRWSGTDISAQSISQAMIWAWNDKQKFDVFAFDAHLDMHRHHAGAGGWGNFYLDLHRSISTAHFPPSLPPIRPQIKALGASSSPMTASGFLTGLAVGPSSVLHGIVLGLAMLLLFPAGVIAMRSGSKKAYTIHWVTQVIASILLLVGVGLGVGKSSKINTVHQYVGIAVASVVGIQGLFGWWHHRRFLKVHRRTWVSYVHMWLGRGFMVAGAGNVVGGLLLRGYSRTSTPVVFFSCLVSLEMVALVVFLWQKQRKAKLSGYQKALNPPWAAQGRNDSFALSLDEEEDLDQEDVPLDDNTDEEKKP